MKIINRFYPHAIAILGFVIISVLYFYPVLQGKQIFQSDIVQYTGMAKEQNDFRAADNVEPFWTNSAFGGMPTYQLGAKYPHDYIGAIDDVLRFLPRPADYLFLYFLGFYGLMLVLKVDPLKAFFGALAFGLSTYLIIILGVGHNAKAHAIAYMPMVIAGFILVFQKKYILGGLVTLLASALEINANHFQMTYYLLIFLLILSAYYSYQFLKDKNYKGLLYSIGILGVAGVFAIGTNATNLLATAEYADFSTRGKSELTYNPDGSTNSSSSALTYDYITEYSYGIAESFNLIAPRLFGGSNNEAVGKDSNMYEFMISQGVPEDQATDFVSGMPTYWGDQPIVAAPAYIGVVVFFLAIMALFIDKRKIKYVFLSGAAVALVLSWGKNFPLVTDFFIDFVPMYNKFRAVSSIQVILELCFPVLAIMGLQSFFTLDKKLQWKALYETTILGLGIFLILFFSKSMFSFSGGSDAYFQENYGPEFVNALKQDRMSLYSADLLRSSFFIIVVSGVLWLSMKEKVAQNTAIIIVGLLMVSDLFFVDKNYVSAKDFVRGSQVEAPFQETPSDAEILKDTSHYRVFEVSGNLSSARASYFHKSIGGYSAVKPRRMQQLFDYQIANNNMEVLNMLDVKYVIQTDKTGKEFPTSNPKANGNAWFVSQVKLVNSADEEMKALKGLDSKNVALVNSNDFKIKNTAFAKDNSARIILETYKPNYLKYVSNNANEGLAVFSEMYYGKGWNAYIDGKSVDHIRVDYVLRGLNIPAGKHTIEFKFEPQVIKTGSMITLISSIGMLLLLAGGIYFERKKKI
ncbi:MAG: YfhO family protein [Flavobacterium sp.]|uniref:YfhO family protein n=1 Tax=Flavobacterium sp. TaxID=239 RepID=UPI001B5526F6|nr:YfhO family protein [Flavobacterium sp.]MBP6145875.1 YfhO family protein [Flavobacterium sp.]MBP7181545.1 YfhO family protein [Flavobacterium sp.]MBP7318456.1 YfhO family protein [Flavobacterium sp.]MBP8887768.1 YfhO family protein [Flavobacterium sp.]HRL70296.1 YfhO family protein [Flavobacterium sp.]